MPFPYTELGDLLSLIRAIQSWEISFRSFGQLPRLEGELPRLEGELPRLEGELPRLEGELPDPKENYRAICCLPDPKENYRAICCCCSTSTSENHRRAEPITTKEPLLLKVATACTARPVLLPLTFATAFRSDLNMLIS